MIMLEAGGWRLEAGGWRLEAGGWKIGIFSKLQPLPCPFWVIPNPGFWGERSQMVS